MTDVLDYGNYLAHYGVKGMKWGVRKDDNRPSSKVTYKEKKSYEYQKKGLSKSEADAKAARADKIRKTALVVGGVSLASVVAYTAGNHYVKNYVGVNLKSGAMLQNVNDVGGSKPQKEGMLYVSFKNHDNKNYRKKYAWQLSNDLGAKNVYATKLSAVEPIKAPSNAKAKKLYEEFKELEKNKRYGDGHSYTRSHDYTEFNRRFNYYGHPEEKKAFANFMRSKGYNAIVDMNDQNPLYGSKKPTILLDSTKSATTVGHEAISKIPTTEQANRMGTIALIKREAQVDAIWGAGVAATIGVKNKHKQTKINKQVDQYFKDHPNTKKSPSEVYMMIAEEQKRGGDNAA